MYLIKNKIFFTLFLSSLIFAKEVEIYTKSMNQHQDIINISDGVVINYDGNLIKAKSGTYNKKDNKIDLNGNVVVIDKDGKKIKSKHLEVFLDTNKVIFKDMFFIDNQDIWVVSKDASKDEQNITLQNAIFSSCCINNPDWSIRFDKAIYDLKQKEIRLKDAKIYIKDIPVFYLPYFYMPLHHERKTGFLMPIYDSNQNEGYIYKQPFFWAISKSRDLEIIPEIRTKRGKGVFVTYRDVLSKDSYLEIKGGYFKDKQSYTQEHNLKYDKQYGIEAFYKNDSVFDSLTNKGYENRLYFNGIYMNNIDYLNLQTEDRMYHIILGSFYESRLNFFLRNEQFFTGLTFSYFKDITKDSNKDTIQILPKLHFHIPLTNLIYNNLSYSFDTTITNFTRESGSKALKIQSSLPINLHFSLLGGYLNLNIEEEFVATGYDFYNVNLKEKKYQLLSLNHTIALSNEMSKIYKSGVHTSIFSATYTKTSILNQKYLDYKTIPEDLKINFIDTIPFESKITFRTHQYYRSFDNSLNINYILESHYYPEDGKLRDLDSELHLNYKYWSFYSRFQYSFLHKTSTDLYNSIGYNSPKYGLNVGFLWKRDILSKETLTRDLNFNGYYNYSSNLNFRANISYDLKNKLLKNWEVGTYLNRKCWSVNFSFGQNIYPVIGKNGDISSISNNYYKVEFLLLPFGG